MRHARSAYFLASIAALSCLLTSAAAHADGGFGALESFFQLLLAQAFVAAIGFAALVAALVSPARTVWVFAVGANAANALMGVAVLLTQPSLFLGSASFQILLGLVGCPSLVAWRRRPPSAAEAAPSSLLGSRWLLLWILGHVVAASVVSGIAQPIIEALLANQAEQPARLLLLLSAIDAVLRGALVGVVQWLLLRRGLAMSRLWVALTLVGTVAASVATLPVGAYFALSAPLYGAVIGLMQWPLLRDRLHKAWLWILLGALVGLAQWPLASLYTAFPAARFGIALALTALRALLLGLTLQFLARRSASVVPAASEH